MDTCLHFSWIKVQNYQVKESVCFNLMKNHQTVFQGGCAVVFSLQWCLSFPAVPHLSQLCWEATSIVQDFCFFSFSCHCTIGLKGFFYIFWIEALCQKSGLGSIFSTSAYPFFHKDRFCWPIFVFSFFMKSNLGVLFLLLTMFFLNFVLEIFVYPASSPKSFVVLISALRSKICHILNSVQCEVGDWVHVSHQADIHLVVSAPFCWKEFSFPLWTTLLLLSIINPPYIRVCMSSLVCCTVDLCLYPNANIKLG